MSYIQIYMFLGFILLLTNVATVHSGSKMTIQQAHKYLQQFGYLNGAESSSANANIISGSSMKSALMDFQRFSGIKATGKLDKTTKQIMLTPRCGVPDNMVLGSGTRSKRYALQGSRWPVSLTYKILNYTEQLPEAGVDAEIARAFAVWTEQAGLNFTKVLNGPADIEIKFAKRDHGDGDAFDGQGGVLAYASFPNYGGDVHFDDDESWTISSYKGINLFQVAAHEFGHSLGLRHSNVNSALMYPYYPGYKPNFKLHPDDVFGIQALYGKKLSNDSLCKDPKIDTIFTSADNQMYAFKGDLYYKLTENSVEEGYPRRISEGWPGLPSDIDAAFTDENGKTYFFKGALYWRYNGRQIDGNFPENISSAFEGIPPNIYAAMVKRGSHQIYFFRFVYIWMFDYKKESGRRTIFKRFYNGLPSGLDAAFQHTNGHVYFFKGDKCYQLNERTDSVDLVEPPFSRSSVKWLFGCNN